LSALNSRLTDQKSHYTLKTYPQVQFIKDGTEQIDKPLARNPHIILVWNYIQNAFRQGKKRVEQAENDFRPSACMHREIFDAQAKPKEQVYTSKGHRNAR